MFRWPLAWLAARRFSEGSPWFWWVLKGNPRKAHPFWWVPYKIQTQIEHGIVFVAQSSSVEMYHTRVVNNSRG